MAQEGKQEKQKQMAIPTKSDTEKKLNNSN